MLSLGLVEDTDSHIHAVMSNFRSSGTLAVSFIGENSTGCVSSVNESIWGFTGPLRTIIQGNC